MLVKFRTSWFSPTEKDIYAKGLNLTISGKRFRKGVQEVPDSLLEQLPKDAEVLEGPPEPEKVEEQTLKDFDQLRKDADTENEIREEAEKTRKSYTKKDKKED